MLEHLKQVEVHLGNIPVHPGWKSSMAAQVSQKVFSEVGAINDALAEKVFTMVVQKLAADGFSSAQIVDVINTALFYEGGIPYCDETEVKEAMG